MQTDWKPPQSPLRRRVALGAVVLVVVVALVVALRPVGARLLSGIRDRPPPALVEPPSDSAGLGAAAGDSARGAAPSPASSPPGREARRTTAGTARSGATARPRVDPARSRTERAAPSPTAPAAAAAVGADAGRLFVNASPWGQLYVDGQLLGNTPKANLSLAPGSHAIRVVREGFEPFERTIQIVAGQSVRLTDIVLVERRP